MTAPALPGVVTQGDTDEDAIAMVKDAIAPYVLDLPSYREPILIEDPSVKAVNVKNAA